jgi:hypothetical protein
VGDDVAGAGASADSVITLDTLVNEGPSAVFLVGGVLVMGKSLESVGAGFDDELEVKAFCAGAAAGICVEVPVVNVEVADI